MERIEEKTIARKVHNIYCDNCKKLIGSSEEQDDGYYDKLGIELPTIKFGSLYYHPYARKIFCKDCFLIKFNEIQEVLANLC